MKNHYHVLCSTGLKENSLHMRWFFEIIRDGLRSESDWQVLKNMDLFNIFLVMFRCGNTKDRVIKKNSLYLLSIFINNHCFILIRY